MFYSKSRTNTAKQSAKNQTSKSKETEDFVLQESEQELKEGSATAQGPELEGDVENQDPPVLDLSGDEAIEKKNQTSKKDPALSEDSEESWKQKYLYLLAEFKNHKKNEVQDKISIRKYASENLIRDLLPTIDLFETALQTEPTSKNLKSIVTGFEYTLDSLLKLLQEEGVQVIDSLHKKFDPQFHEAIEQEETSEFDKGVVIKEFKKGYTLKDRVIRAAQVVVSKKKK